MTANLPFARFFSRPTHISSIHQDYQPCLECYAERYLVLSYITLVNTQSDSKLHVSFLTLPKSVILTSPPPFYVFPIFSLQSKRRTKTVLRSVSPTWNQTFMYTLKNQKVSYILHILLESELQKSPNKTILVYGRWLSRLLL